MKVIPQKREANKKRSWRRIVFTTLGFLFVLCAMILAFFVAMGKQGTITDEAVSVQTFAILDTTELQFPVGVDSFKKEIAENPLVSTYFEKNISTDSGAKISQTNWLSKTLGNLALMDWYQNLASLSSRILIIQSGERKEQVADHFAKILKWDSIEKEEFLTLVNTADPKLEEGKFFPGNYTVAKGAIPEDVATLVLARFKKEILDRYGSIVEEKVPLAEALTIASLLEREAYDFTDMRHISGVIWNRLFTDMRLQIDATLQYAKGSKPTQPWWPRVLPSDKYIASAYNTYKIQGLPPAPIANPSLEAILAALNPTKTDCMYYFHDRDAGFHCTETYEEHVALLKQYYGRGK